MAHEPGPLPPSQETRMPWLWPWTASCSCAVAGICKNEQQMYNASLSPSVPLSSPPWLSHSLRSKCSFRADPHPCKSQFHSHKFSNNRSDPRLGPQSSNPKLSHVWGSECLATLDRAAFLGNPQPLDGRLWLRGSYFQETYNEGLRNKKPNK